VGGDSQQPLPSQEHQAGFTSSPLTTFDETFQYPTAIPWGSFAINSDIPALQAASINMYSSNSPWSTSDASGHTASPPGPETPDDILSMDAIIVAPFHPVDLSALDQWVSPPQPPSIISPLISPDSSNMKHKRRRRDKIVPCEISGCSATFPFKSEMKRHALHRHQSVSMPCPFCERPIKGTRKDNLRRHIRSFHPQELCP